MANLYAVKVKPLREAAREIEITAPDATAARRQAERLGKVLTVRKKTNWNLQRGLTLADRQIFFTRLSSMLASRVGTSEALRLIRDTFGGRIEEVSGKLLAYIETGDDLGSAIEKVGAPDFPEATVALIKSGSKTGETWRAVQEASGFEYELNAVKKSASKGLISGVVGFIAAGLTTILSTHWVGPEIRNSPLMKFAATRGDGINTEWISATGNVLGWVMVVIMTISVLMWLFAAVGRQLFPVTADGFILRIPYYKDLVLSRNNFIVLYGLSMLVRSGVRTEEALRLSADSAPRGALRQDLLAAYNAVRTGKPWPKVMATLHPTDKAALLCAVDREQIASTLDTLAKQYRELYAQRLGTFVPTLQMVSALFLTMGGGILFGEAILPMLMATANMLG